MTASDTSDRRAFYDRLKTALNDGAADATRRAAVQQRLSNPPNHPKPARIQTSGADRVAQFRGYLEGQSAVVHEAASAADVPRLVAAYLRSQNAPLRVRMGDDAMLKALPWQSEPALETQHGRATPADEVGLTRAMAGISETGTLMLTSGAANPVTLNFMPETHIVVIETGAIVGSYEEAWGRLRDMFGATQMSRTVNFISGPSRTGDIGGRIVMGAHGPKNMCVIIVASDAAKAL